MLRKSFFAVLFMSMTTSGSLLANPFDQGTISFSASIGSGRAYDNDYTVFGVGIGYYLLDGLHLGADYEYWSGGNPTIEQFSPRIGYVFARQQQFSPYVGAFYRKTRVENLPDRDARGARAGTHMKSGDNFTFGFGVVYVEYANCTESIYTTCSETYPELSFGAAF